MASSKLDSATSRNWEEFSSNLEFRTLNDFFGFLRQRSVLETVQASKAVTNAKKFNNIVKSKSVTSSSSTSESSIPIVSIFFSFANSTQ